MLNVKTFVVVGVIVAAIIGVGTVMGQDDSVCVTGGAVPTGSAGLISDCETLLGVKSALRGTAKLNWWSGRSIEKWDGITVENGRVVGVSLPNRSLNGVIPTGFGSLSALKTLDLSGNSLTGTIPASLNNLTALTKWRLAGNGLSGCVPYNFAQVSDNDLASLGLSTCGGSGPAPTAVPTTVPTAVPTTIPTIVPQTHSRIVFASNRDGNDEIYVMNPDGSGQTRLTDNSAADGSPSWSPDGHRIVFHSGRDGNADIYVMNADGSGQTRLTDNRAADGSPSWSPDGHRIAFTSTRDENYNIYVMNADGSDQTRLTNNPAWDFSPSWSPDGRRIAFTSNRDENYNIYVMNADGSDQTRLTNNPAWDFSPSWSPDGRRIAFISTRDGNPEIYVMNADGSDQMRLTDNPASDSRPSWSPDGCRIVFQSNRDDPDPNDRITINDIYVMNVCETRLTNNSGSNGAPSWSIQGVPTPTPTVTLTPTPSPAATLCANGTAVPNPAANPSPVSDCDVLLGARDTLAGGASLNWSENVPISRWRGISVGGSPTRVTGIHLGWSSWQHQASDRLRGSIPPALSKLSALQVLILYGNQLSGTIPRELGNLTNLTYLHLYSNRLSGSIPPELGKLTNLTRMDLGGNQLSGPVPSELSRLTKLTNLRLSSNNLSGPIPSWLGGLSTLTWLSLGGNNWSGPVPSELGNLSNLEVLDLTRIRWSGPIPSWLGNLSKLKVLNLYGNLLTGATPAELSRLTNLEILVLADNAGLSGPLPGSYAGLRQLHHLDLTGTQLCAPTDAAFQAWLRGVETKEGVTNCAAGNTTPTPTPVPLSPPPSDLGLDPFYKKYLDAGGLPIVASDKVPDGALYQAREIIDEMLANGPDIRAELIELGRRVTVVSDDEVITDIPEFRDLYEEYPGTDWNSRVQGGGLAGNIEDHTTAIWEGNLLCNENNVFPREDILVHEFAHTILNMGVERQPGGREFRRRLEEAYRKALDADLWGQTYAGENSEEYWAEGVQSWFGLNDWAIPANGVHSQINTRHELEAYDPGIADLIEEVFGDTSISSTCHTVAASVDAGEEGTIEFLGEVSPAKRAEVRALVADIRNVFSDYAAGKSPPEPLFVVSYDQETLQRRFKEIEGYEHGIAICGSRSHSNRLYISLEPVCGRPGVFAHEYFHYLQGAIAPGHLLPYYGEGYSTFGPWWLTEGAAVYNSLSYTVARGIESYHVERDRMIRKAAQSTSSLADLELAQDFFNDSGAYEVGFLAVEWLARHSSDASILRYYELLLQHDTWQAAFENAFGVAVSEFYESFEEHRSGLLPTRHRIAGVVLGPAGEPLEGIGIWAWQGEADNSGFDRTGPGGEFDISVPDGSFTLDVYAAGPGCSFVGWYDGNSITASYDEAVRVTVDGESVGGIEIRLPAHPDDLPRVAWCS